jgi:uncharacterized alpha-E superfamily protein
VDELNPRSIGFQIADLADQLYSLGRSDDPEHRRLEELVCGTLSEIRAASLSMLAQRDSDGSFVALESYLRQLKTNLNEFSEALTTQYLSPAKASLLTASW